MVFVAWLALPNLDIRPLNLAMITVSDRGYLPDAVSRPFLRLFDQFKKQVVKTNAPVSPRPS